MSVLNKKEKRKKVLGIVWLTCLLYGLDYSVVSRRFQREYVINKEKYGYTLRGNNVIIGYKNIGYIRVLQDIGRMHDDKRTTINLDDTFNVESDIGRFIFQTLGSIWRNYA